MSFISIFLKERKAESVIRWNFIFYMITFLYSMLIGVVLVPLYLIYIPRDIYGYWLATGNILVLLTIIDPGFSAVVQQKISLNYGQNNFSKIGQYSFIGSSIGIAFSLLVLIVGLIVYHLFPFLFLDLAGSHYLNDIKTAFVYALIGSVLMILYYIIGAIDYALLSSKGIGIINCIGNFGSLISIAILLHLGYGIKALGLAALIRGCLYLSLSLMYTYFRFKYEKIELTYNRSLFKEFAGLTGFNFLGKIGQNLTIHINSYVSAAFVGPTQATTLKFTQTVPEFSKQIVVRIINSSVPVFSNLLGNGDQIRLKKILSQLLYCVLWILGIILVGFYLLNESFILLWVGRDFYGGYWMNFWVIILLFFSITSDVFSQIAFALGNIKGNSIVFFIQGIIYLLIVFISAKYFGLIGILIAGIVAHLLTSVWYFPSRLFFALKLNKINLRNGINEFLRVFFIGLFIIFVFQFLFGSNSHNWIAFIFRVLTICSIYVSCLFLFSSRFRLIVKLFLNRLW